MNDPKENPLYKSWHDSNWIPHLNPTNVLDYFCERSNIFYEKTCNNEILRMQQKDLSQLDNMTGIEYIVLHAQDPILYVIRKQNRHSPGPNGAVAIADYYVIAGYVYQAPDLNSVINARLMTAVHHLQSAFDETLSYMRYNPSRGYSWEFSKDKSDNRDKKEAVNGEKSKDKPKEDATSSFQRRKVDLILPELVKKFPAKVAPVNPTDSKATEVSEANPVNGKGVKTNTDTDNNKRSASGDSLAGSQAKKQRNN